MTTGTMQIAAERQRERIPTGYLMQFEEITNAELASMALESGGCPQEWRSYAGWELEYRESFGIDVYYDEKAGLFQVRSASRLGRRDFGVNRARVESLRKRLS